MWPLALLYIYFTLLTNVADQIWLLHCTSVALHYSWNAHIEPILVHMKLKKNDIMKLLLPCYYHIYTNMKYAFKCHICVTCEIISCSNMRQMS